MNKKKSIFIIKIVAVLVWIAVLLTPTLYSKIKPTEYVDSRLVSAVYVDEEETEVAAVFAVDFSEKIKEGKLKFSFKESKNGPIVFSSESKVKNNDSKTVTVTFISKKFLERNKHIFSFFREFITGLKSKEQIFYCQIKKQ